MRSGASVVLLVLGTLLAAWPALAGSPPADVPLCPEGSERHGAALPKRDMTWCQDAEGRRQGPFVAWHRNGALEEIGQYRDDLKEGWWRVWNDAGEPLAEREYRRNHEIARRRVGKAAGPVRASRPGDPVHPCPAGAVVAGSAPPEGATQWCEKLRADGAYVRHGVWLSFASTRLPPVLSKREEYFEGVRHGRWVEYWQGEKQREEHYVDGVKHGMSTSWYPHSVKAAQVEYVRGKPSGPLLRWDEQGRIEYREDQDAAGRKRRTWYHPTGRPKSQDHWSHGKPDGLERAWWPNGKLRLEGRWTAGNKVGGWREWTADGDLERATRYVSGGETTSETFAAYVDPPPGAPAPVGRGEERMTNEPLRCPAGSRRVSEDVKLGFGDVLMSLDDSGGPSGPVEELQDRVVREVFNLVQTPVLRIEACAGGVLGNTKEGPAVVTTPDGRRVADGHYRHGRKHGRWTFWASDGSRAGLHEYRDGKRHGTWLEWHDGGGPLASLESYSDGVLHGPFAYWWSNGAYRATGVWRNGRKHGTWSWHEISGFRCEQGEYRDDRKNGLWIRRDPFGGIEEKEYRNDVLHGRFADRDSRGQYRNGKKHGLWSFNFAGRKAFEGYYDNGVREGEWTLYYRDGTPKARGRFERDRRVGRWIEYHENGRKSAEGNYVWCASPPKSVVTALPPDGQMEYRDPAPPGCRLGTWSFWYDNGEARGSIALDDQHAPANLDHHIIGVSN